MWPFQKKTNTDITKTSTDQKGKFVVIKGEKGTSNLYAAFTEKERTASKRKKLEHCGITITKEEVIERSVADVNEIFTLKNDRKNRDQYVAKVKEYLGTAMTQTKETPTDTKPTEERA